MRVRYDPSANAAYIKLIDKIDLGQVKKSYHCDLKKVGGIISLDFDSEGRLLGIEVLDAMRYLPEETLNQAEVV
jgi:uncharacterized protein YuzE